MSKVVEQYGLYRDGPNIITKAKFIEMISKRLEEVLPAPELLLSIEIEKNEVIFRAKRLYRKC